MRKLCLIVLGLLSAGCALAGQAGGLNDAIAMYSRGEYEESIRKLEPFAANDSSIAQLILGKALLRADRRSHNCEKAKYWLARSAEAGTAEGAFILGDVLNSASCGASHKWRALRWYLRADSLGHGDAANEIGEIYLSEASHASDAFEARLWFIRGVRHYDWRAANNLGLMYMHARGVGKDMQEAYKWYQVAYLQMAFYSTERNEVLEARDRARDSLTPAQVKEATRMADGILDAVVADFRRPEAVGPDCSYAGMSPTELENSHAAGVAANGTLGK